MHGTRVKRPDQQLFVQFRILQQIPKLTDGHTQGLSSKGEDAIGVIILCDGEVH